MFIFLSIQLGSHDRSRIATRAGADKVDALNVMLMTLPGTPFVYYGEEIGMKDVPVPAEQKQDNAPVSSIGCGVYFLDMVEQCWKN